MKSKTNVETVENVVIGLMQCVFVKSECMDYSNIETATGNRILTESTIGPITLAGGGKFEGSLKVPIWTPPSQVGGLISIRYRVAVVGNERISVPILIGHPH